MICNLKSLFLLIIQEATLDKPYVMKTHSRRPVILIRILLGAAFVAGSVALTSAALTNVAWYRLGELDPGGIAGLSVTNTTADTMGVRHLRQFGNPLYTNAVSGTASNRVGSGLAIQFNGSASQLLSNSFVSAANDNFGFEAWIRPDAVDSNFRIIIGNGTPGLSGWGLLQQEDLVAGYIGNQVTYGVPVSMGVWAHVAVVMASGDASIYLNGQYGGTLPLPTAFGAGPFTVGGGEGTGFLGAIDEVRVFTFASGQFSTNDLLFNLQRVQTLPAVVNGSNATLNAQVHPLGTPTSAWFEWGATTNYGNTTPPQQLSGANIVNLSQVLTNLVGDVDYQFRLIVSNHLGAVLGTNQTLRMPARFSLVMVQAYPGSDEHSEAWWGDYDNDGHLDIGGSWGFKQNTSSGVTNTYQPMPPSLLRGCVAWGDYNNDGRLDFLQAGFTQTGFISQVWRNTGSGFANINVGLPGLNRAIIAWGDYDNDGRLDFLFGGELWRNTEGGFTRINAGLPSVGTGSGASGDYDNDGRLDILLTGSTSNGPISQVWRNTGSGFTDINAGLPGVVAGSGAWGDYDNDGRMDILLTGSTTNGSICQVWRNTGSGFSNINAGLPGVESGSGAWGDYDNDGRLDILLAGNTGGISLVAQVWRNTGGSGFTNVNAGLPGVHFGSAAWGDYDNDGRLDILLSGNTNFGLGCLAQVWRNENGLVTNSPPTPPSGLTATVSEGLVHFSWNAASDLQTPSAGLSYNLRIGTTPGGTEILAPSSALNGWRRLPNLGNVQQGLSASFNLAAGTSYYWSVQAIDSALAGSPFSPESSFKLMQLPPVVTPITATNLMSGDLDGDGRISEGELQSFLGDYFSTSPFLQITNVAGLGSTNVTFALTNALAGAFSVEYSTNLADWYLLGPATPRYLFTDTNAFVVPERHYRLRWP